MMIANLAKNSFDSIDMMIANNGMNNCFLFNKSQNE
jgi:hypothetical protein